MKQTELETWRVFRGEDKYYRVNCQDQTAFHRSRIPIRLSTASMFNMILCFKEWRTFLSESLQWLRNKTFDVIWVSVHLKFCHTSFNIGLINNACLADSETQPCCKWLIYSMGTWMLSLCLKIQTRVLLSSDILEISGLFKEQKAILYRAGLHHVMWYYCRQACTHAILITSTAINCFYIFNEIACKCGSNFWYGE